MLRFLEFCGILLGFAVFSLDAANLQMPVQSYPWDDEKVNEILNGINYLKTANELLNTRLDVVYVRLDSVNVRLDAMHPLPNTNSEMINKGNYKDKHNIVETQLNGVSVSPHKFFSDCAEASASGGKSGVYTIKPSNYEIAPFPVYCDFETYGGNWTVIQRRKDGFLNFLRKWTDFKMGFGSLEGEFFIGLEKLHAMSFDKSQELLIVMKDFDDIEKYAKYETFVIGDESDNYTLYSIGKYSGDAGDSLRYQVSQKFTTIDRDNDKSTTANCAVDYKGAWWHNKCHTSNLNGIYIDGGNATAHHAQGIVWNTFRGLDYSLKFVEMRIRPKPHSN